MKNLLFLCTGNSARSILAEAILNRIGAGKYAAFSAGSQPAGRVNPGAAMLLQAQGFDTSLYRSKSWDEYAGPDAPRMDVIITVCDSAAGESCPIWPGHPLVAHWGLRDPAGVTGDDQNIRAAFEATFETLQKRLTWLVSLPSDDLNREALHRIATLFPETDIPDPPT